MRMRAQQSGLLCLRRQLDNNIIEKMENLDHLTNLTWLDLSFNNIAVIEGVQIAVAQELVRRRQAVATGCCSSCSRCRSRWAPCVLGC
jgi:hypothetical protein